MFGKRYPIDLQKSNYVGSFAIMRYMYILKRTDTYCTTHHITMNGLLSIVLSITILKYTFADINDTITFSTPSGKVKGFITESPKGREIAAFQGIPYGQPPVGNLRFKPPIKAKPWEGVLDGTKKGTPCKQLFVESDEDCLNLNVYTPQTNESFEELYPVMVGIFGGAFARGEAVPPMPQPLLDKNIVMVFMNYRLGVFGYATTLDEVLPGNYGQLDQILALKWVQENIAYFGGDPKRVTLYGSSSGSMSVMGNIVSPLSNGLIHRAIMGSGCVICKNTFCRTNERFTSQIAKRFNSSATSSQSIKGILQSIHGSEYAVWKGYIVSSFMFNVDNTSGYMPLVPDEMAYQPNVAKIPVMISTLPNDGAIIGKVSHQRSKNGSNFLTSLGWMLEELQSFSTANMDNNIKLIMAEYNIQHPENMSISDILKYLMDIATDSIYASCCDTSIETLSRAGFPVYAYKFNHVSNLTTDDDGTILGHASDIQFTWSSYVDEKYSNMTGSDLMTSQNLIEFWANFAKYGNPNPVHSKPEDDDDDDGQSVWRQWTVDSPGHMLLNESPSMEDGYFSNHTQFWNNHSMC